MELLQPNDIKVDVKEQNKTEYNPYQKPAVLELAKKHGQAKRVYMNLTEKEMKLKHREVCACCGLSVEGDPVPLTASLDKLYHLGAGFPLYFMCIQYSVGILVLLFLITGIYNIISNAHAKDCEPFVNAEQIYCLDGYITSYTISNKRQHTDLLTAQVAVNLGGVLAIILFFHFFRYQFRKIEIEAEDKTTTPSDYTVSIDGIPPKATEDDISHFFQGFETETTPIKIVRVIKPLIMSDYIELTNKIHEINQQQTELKKNSEANKMRLGRLDKDLQRAEKKLAALKNQKPEYSSIAYVTFEMASQADFIRDKFKLTLWQQIVIYFVSWLSFCCPCGFESKYQFQGKSVIVKRAPEPTDIMWENLGSRKSLFSRIVTRFVTIVLIALTFGVTFLINWGQQRIDIEDTIVVQIFSIIGSVVIAISNAVLSLTIDHLTRFERHYTYTHFLQGVANMLTLAQVFNSAFSTLIVEFLLADTPEGKDRLQSVNFYGPGGVLENIYWVFITNSVLTPFLTMFDFGYIFKVFRRIISANKDGTANMMQKDAHNLYEGSNMLIPVKYATTMKMMLMACFYAPFMPFSLIYAVAGLVLCYWADKYVLLRRHALPKSLNDSLAKDMVESLEWAAFFFSMGNIACVFSLKDFVGDIAFSRETTPMVWITFGISLFHIFFPMESLNTKLFPIKDLVTEIRSFEDARISFTTDYDLENPSTRKKALEQHIIRMKKGEGQLSFLSNLRNSEFDRKDVLENFVSQVTNGGRRVSFLDRLKNSDFSKGTPGVESLFGLKDSEHDYRFWDNYAEKLHKKKTNSFGNFFAQLDPGAGPNNKQAKDFLTQYFSEVLNEHKGDSPLHLQNPEIGSPEEGRFLKETETKVSLIPWLQQMPTVKSPSNQGDDSTKKMLDLAALNFVAPHFKEEASRRSKHGPDSSGNIDPEDCVEESEPTAREFVVQRSLRDKNGGKAS